MWPRNNDHVPRETLSIGEVMHILMTIFTALISGSRCQTRPYLISDQRCLAHRRSKTDNQTRAVQKLIRKVCLLANLVQLDRLLKLKM